MDEKLEAMLAGAKKIEEKFNALPENRTPQAQVEVVKTIIEEMKKGTAIIFCGRADVKIQKVRDWQNGGEKEERLPAFTPRILNLPNGKKAAIVFTSTEEMQKALEELKQGGEPTAVIWPILQVFTFLVRTDLDGLLFNVKGASQFVPKQAVELILRQAGGVGNGPAAGQNGAAGSGQPGTQQNNSAAQNAEHQDGQATILHPNFGRAAAPAEAQNAADGTQNTAADGNAAGAENGGTPHPMRIDPKILAALSGAQKIEDKLLTLNEKSTPQEWGELTGTIIGEMKNGTALVFCGKSEMKTQKVKDKESGEEKEVNLPAFYPSILNLPAAKEGENGRKAGMVFTSLEELQKAAPQLNKNNDLSFVIWPIKQVFACVREIRLDCLVFNAKGSGKIVPRQLIEAMLLQESALQAGTNVNGDSAAGTGAAGNSGNAANAENGAQNARRTVIRRAAVPKDFTASAIFGAAVGDALGLSSEGVEREELAKKPVKEITGGGLYDKPAGTWSGAVSLMLAEMDALSTTRTATFNDAMDNFFDWRIRGEFTPDGTAFGADATTEGAIMRYATGVKLLDCGGSSEDDNGNGALKRILPYAMLLCVGNGIVAGSNRSMIHTASKITHDTARSMLACELYAMILRAVVFAGRGTDKRIPVTQAVSDCVLYYRALDVLGIKLKDSGEGDNDEEALKAHREEMEEYDAIRAEFPNFVRLVSPLIMPQGYDAYAKLPEDKIRSTEYCVDTLEAAVWCFLNTNSYQECVLKAVNLGGDTSVIAGLAGGLAGAYYGTEAIPAAWKSMLVRADYLEALCTLYSARYFPERKSGDPAAGQKTEAPKTEQNLKETAPEDLPAGIPETEPEKI